MTGGVAKDLSASCASVLPLGDALSLLALALALYLFHRAAYAALCRGPQECGPKRGDMGYQIVFS